MQTKQVVTSALAAALALGLAGPTFAAEAAKEKCYGVAKAGKNDCSNLSGTHSCAGQSTKDGAVDDWNFVAKGSCAKAGGLTAEQAKAKMKK